MDSGAAFANVPKIEGIQHDEQLALHWPFCYISTIDFVPVEHDKHKGTLAYRNFRDVCFDEVCIQCFGTCWTWRPSFDQNIK